MKEGVRGLAWKEGDGFWAWLTSHCSTFCVGSISTPLVLAVLTDLISEVAGLCSCHLKVGLATLTFRCHTSHLYFPCRRNCVLYPLDIGTEEFWAFPGAQWQRTCLQYRKPRFEPWVGKISCRRAWQPTPVFLPGESHRQRSLAGYGP